jgi:hypothetical protein
MVLFLLPGLAHSYQSMCPPRYVETVHLRLSFCSMFDLFFLTFAHIAMRNYVSGCFDQVSIGCK